MSNRDFVIMGIARSGTSLACKLISECVENAYCLNETEINVPKVPAMLADTRRRLVKGLPVKNRWRDDSLSSDTVRVKAPIEERIAEGAYDKDAVVGVKMVQNYKAARDAGLFAIAMLRDPVFTIASWNQSGDIVWSHVLDHDMDPIWRNRRIEFKGETVLERQCELWEHHAKMIVDAVKADHRTIQVWQYEDFVWAPDGFLFTFAHRYGLKCYFAPELENKNDPSRFTGLDEIRAAVKSLCPTRIRFGYR